MAHSGGGYWVRVRTVLLVGILTVAALMVARPVLSQPDLGNTSQARNDPAYQALPADQRTYYENGDPRFNHDGVGGHDANGNGVRDGGEAAFDRADLASFCARYNRGGAPDAALPAAPTTNAQFTDLIEKIKKCVDDLLSPDKDPQNGATVTDADIVGMVNSGRLGIGNPMTPAEFTASGFPGRDGFVCINHARFFVSLLRELGFAVREVNVVLSKMVRGAHQYTYQEAATQIWFNGGWHYFDSYITTPGNPAAETNPDGLLGGGWTDRKVHVATTRAPDFGDYDPRTGDPLPGSGWNRAPSTSAFQYEKIARAATIEQNQPGVHVYVHHGPTMNRAGFPPSLAGVVVPDSFSDVFLQPEQTGAVLEIPGSAYIPPGVPDHRRSEPVLPLPVGQLPETVVLNDPGAGTHCVTVWDASGVGAPFNLLVSTEGGLTTTLPRFTADRLSPGEVRQVACGDFTSTDDGFLTQVFLSENPRSRTEWNDGFGIFDPVDSTNSCLAIEVLRSPVAFGSYYSRLRIATTALESTTTFSGVSTPGAGTPADDCFGLRAPGNLVGFSDGQTRTGMTFNLQVTLPGNMMADLSNDTWVATACQITSATSPAVLQAAPGTLPVTGAALACAGGFNSVDLSSFVVEAGQGFVSTGDELPFVSDLTAISGVSAWVVQTCYTAFVFDVNTRVGSTRSDETWFVVSDAGSLLAADWALNGLTSSGNLENQDKRVADDQCF